MIITASFGSTGTPPVINLAHYQTLVTAVARAGIDAALFVRSPGPRAPMLDALPLIAALASEPVGIGLGASIPIDYTEPFHLARSYAAIDRLTHGRSALVVDFAAGTDLAPQLGHSLSMVERYARAEEFFQVVTQLWDSWQDDALLVDRPAGLFTDSNKIHRINYDGAYFAVRGPLNAPRPIQGWPVIIMPVVCARSRDLAAQFADVALIACSTLDAVQSAGVEIRAKAAAHGRRLQSIRILADLVPILGPTEMDAQKQAAALGEGSTRGLRVVGTPKQLAALMRNWHAVGACDGFNLLPPMPLPKFDLFAACVTALTRRPVAGGATLRDRLELPRPSSCYAA